MTAVLEWTNQNQISTNQNSPGADIVGDDAGQTLECCCLDTGHMGGGKYIGQW